MHEKKVNYGSWSEINTIEERMHRHKDLELSSTSMVDHSNFISLWSDKMEEVDPDGKQAIKIATKYHN